MSKENKTIIWQRPLIVIVGNDEIQIDDVPVWKDGEYILHGKDNKLYFYCKRPVCNKYHEVQIGEKVGVCPFDKT